MSDVISHIGFVITGGFIITSYFGAVYLAFRWLRTNTPQPISRDDLLPVTVERAGRGWGAASGPIYCCGDCGCTSSAAVSAGAIRLAPEGSGETSDGEGRA